MVYVIVDYWKVGNIYYAIYYRDNELYFSEAIVSENLKDK